MRCELVVGGITGIERSGVVIVVGSNVPGKSLVEGSEDKREEVVEET